MPISQNVMDKLFSLSAVCATARPQSVVLSSYSVKKVVITAAAAAFNVAADMQYLDTQWQSHLVSHYHASQLDFHLSSQHVIALPASLEQQACPSCVHCPKT